MHTKLLDMQCRMKSHPDMARRTDRQNQAHPYRHGHLRMGDRTNKKQTHKRRQTKAKHMHTSTQTQVQQVHTHTRTHYKSRQAHKHKPQTNTHLPPTCTSADGLPHANRARCTHHGMASAHAHLRASCRERRSSYMSCVGTMHVILPIYMAMAHT